MHACGSSRRARPSASIACARNGAGPFGGAVQALQSHVLAHLQRGLPLENAAADYLPNLHVQAAVYRSHASGTRVLMAGFDPHTPPNP